MRVGGLTRHLDVLQIKPDQCRERKNMRAATLSGDDRSNRSQKPAIIGPRKPEVENAQSEPAEIADTVFRLTDHRRKSN
jgi:hypothetical protein